MRDLRIHDILAEDEVIVVDAHLVEQGCRDVDLRRDSADDTRALDGSACPHHRNAEMSKLMILHGLWILGIAMVGQDHDKQIIPSRCNLQAVDESTETAIGIGCTVAIRIVETMERHVERLMAAQSLKHLEIRLCSRQCLLARDKIEGIVEHNAIGNTPL